MAALSLACEFGGGASSSGSAETGDTSVATSEGSTSFSSGIEEESSSGGETETESTTDGDESTGGDSSGGTGDPPSLYEWDLPEGFPEPFVPADNPMTAEKVDLGHFLFYDRRFSGNGTQACSDCHFQDKAFADGLVAPVGSTGEAHHRNSMSLTNSGYSFPLTWVAPTLPTLEQQLMVPIFGDFPVELGVAGNEDEVLGRLREDPIYQERFAAAFPEDADPFTIGNSIRALASFVRTMISGNSRYDQYSFQGDLDALSDAEVRGLDLFFSERLECHHCHGNFNFTLASKTATTVFDPILFSNTGMYNLGSGNYPAADQGLIAFTNDPEDMGKFRPPTLRNIALTAPYGHDGSIETLEEVIRIYERGGRLIEDGPNAGDGATNPYKSGLIPGFEITDQEREDLIAFLEALTDEDFLTDPRFANPFE